jgi:hypothetical protein
MYFNLSSTIVFTTAVVAFSKSEDLKGLPLLYGSLLVYGNGAAAAAWTINFEVSLDNTHWTPVFRHTNTNSVDGQMVFSSQTAAIIQTTISAEFPATYFRINASALTLGLATSITCIALGTH